MAIFHFIGAALRLLGILFLVGHYAVMHAVFTNPKFMEGQKGDPLPTEDLAILKWIYLAGAAWFVMASFLKFISGFCLFTRKGRTFSVVVAGFNCLQIPVGTVLGVFTMIVLLRDSVRELYDSVGRP